MGTAKDIFVEFQALQKRANEYVTARGWVYHHDTRSYTHSNYYHGFKYVKGVMMALRQQKYMEGDQ